MNRSFAYLGLFVSFIFLQAVFGYSGNELFRDDFNGESLDSEKWEYRNADNSRVSGITQFNDPPEIAGGMLTLTHHTYNPYDQHFCLSQEIYTKQIFDPNQALQFEARIRLRGPIGNGLVAGFYTYMDKPKSETDPNRINDEIDFEFLTNQINSPYPATEGDRVYMSVYNDFDGNWLNSLKHWRTNPNVPPINLGDRPLLNLTQFNIFKIRWLAGRLEWYWEPDDGKGDILLYKTSNVLPDEGMAVYFNFWAADEYWPIAWDENLTSVSNPEDNVVNYFDVDYVVVSSIIPDNCDEIWVLGEGLQTDYNRDCIVNLSDFIYFAENWLKSQ
jgi:hypothetical protein